MIRPEVDDSIVDRCQTIALPRINDQRGSLTFMERGRHIPFEINRVYYLYDVPAGAGRGGHAHKELEQVMVALAGSFDVIVDDGRTSRTVHLHEPHRGLYVGRLIWREMRNFSPGAVCLVMASDFYKESDYFRDYNEFLSAGCSA